MLYFQIKEPFTIKKKIGTFRKKEIEYKVVPYTGVSGLSTLYRIHREIAERIGDYRTKEILHHTPKIEYYKKDDSTDYTIVAPSADDAFLYHIFFQILALPVAMKNKKIRGDHLTNATARVVHTHALDEEVYAIPGKVEPEDLKNPRINGHLMKKFDDVINEESIPQLAKTWVEGLHEAGIYGVTEKEVEQYMRKALKLAKKIKNKLHPEEVDIRLLKKEDPRIQIVLNDEDFRQFLAEISGKKIEEKPFIEEEDEEFEDSEELPRADLSREAAKLLGLVKGLMLAGASGESLRNTEESLWKEIKRLEAEGELELIGLYAVVIAHLRENDLEGAERFLEGF